MQYRVHLTYYRPSGTMGSAFYTIEANAPSQALDMARKLARAEKTRRIEKWAKCSAGPLSDPPPFTKAYAGPIRDGERITVPVTGTVEIERSGTILLHGHNKNASLRLSAEQVRKHTGRELSPRAPVVTVEYLALYPSQWCYPSDRPVRTSSYELSQLVQVKVTRHDGVIVNKEIV